MWSAENMKDAKLKWEFIIVSSLNDTRVNITSATKFWSINPKILFQTGYRIAGTPEDITKNLQLVGFFDEEIKSVIETSISSSNYYTDMESVYQSELDSYNLWKRKAIKSNVQSQGFNLFDFITAVNPSVLPLTELPVYEKQPKRKGRTKSLFDKLSSLPQANVLDVSGLKPDGSGVNSIPRPKRSKKYGSPNLSIVSDNMETYKLALSMLPGGADNYKEDIEYVTQLFSQSEQPSPKYNVPTAKYNIPSPKYNVPTAKYNIPTPKYNIPTPKLANISSLINVISQMNESELADINKNFGEELLTSNITYDNFTNILYNFYLNRKPIDEQDKINSAASKIDVFVNSPLDQLFKDNLIDKNMLDVGSGDGLMGYVFASRYELNPVYSDVGRYTILEPFILYGTTEQIDTDIKFGVVTLFHLLNNMQTQELLEGRINDIFTLLKDGGLLVLRESDVLDQTMKKKLELTHILDELNELEKGRSKEDVMNWINSYSMLSYNYDTLNNIILSFGFKLLDSTNSMDNGIYFSLYQKSNQTQE